MSSKVSARPEQCEATSADKASSEIHSDCDALVDRIDRLANAKSREAWAIFNTLSFMIAALPHDPPDGLPVQCTLIDLKSHVEALASGLGDLVHGARHG